MKCERIEGLHGWRRNRIGHVAVAAGRVVEANVGGGTNSTQTTFPEAVGPDLTYNGGNDAFVAR